MDTTLLDELVRDTLKAFRPPKLQTPSEWADDNRILVSESSSEVGRWHTDRAPYQRRVMDCFTDDTIWKIVLQSSSQVGKTEIELNCLGRAIDIDPGPMLYVQPTKDLAQDFSKRRVQTMIDACTVLRRKVADNKSRDSGNTITSKHFPGGSLSMIGANAPGDLASRPIRYLFMDEVDRFPATAGTEGNPMQLAERRTETFRHNRKVMITGTPTLKGGNVDKEFQRGTQEEYETECPECRKYSVIRFDDIKFEKEEYEQEDEKGYRVTKVWWCCPVCRRNVTESAAKRSSGRWTAHNPNAAKEGIVSFRLSAFVSPWSDWKSIAQSFVDAKDDQNDLQVFYNTMLGEVWDKKVRTQEPDRLYARRERYNADIPDGVLVLTCGIDTQDNRLEYEVVGWDAHEQSWGICYGVIPGRADTKNVWDEVDELLDRRWETENGAMMRISASFMDSGGHFTDDVYRECAKRMPKKLFAIKGEAGQGKPYVHLMKKSKDGREAVKFMVGVDTGKESIMYASSIEEKGARYMHFPLGQDKGYTEEYFRGLMSEKMMIRHKRGVGTIEWEKIYSRNEPLDCRNYARAAYKYFNWNFKKLHEKLTGDDEPVVMTQKQAEKQKPRRIISRGIEV